MLRSSSDSENHLVDQRTFDTVIVFGQGPVKPLLLPNEMTLEQHTQWIDYQQDIAHNWEPDFFMIQQTRQLLQLKQIDDRQDINTSTKEYLKLTRRSEWQHTGWFALKKWGRQNALAAGFALYKGMTKEVILSGGKTIPKWAVQRLPPAYLDDWPSEAELMRDIMVRQYGDLYLKKYHKDIESVIKLEDAATNTIENFSYCINKDPRLIMEGVHIGMITANYHLKRVSLLARIFSLHGASLEQYSAQDILKEQISDQQVIEIEAEVEEDVTDLDDNPQLDMIMRVEERWLQGLNDPRYITYWLGYLGDVNYPTVIQNALNRLKQPSWKAAADKAFQQLGMRLDDYLNTDLAQLRQKEPTKYGALIAGLKKLKQAPYRTAPPEL